MGTVFITGYLSEKLMVEDHYEYYVKIMKKAGLEHEILPPHNNSVGKPAKGKMVREESDTTSADVSFQTVNTREGESRND
jgi:hypothetical protein